jgi:uncharacterized membrane protein
MRGERSRSWRIAVVVLSLSLVASLAGVGYLVVGIEHANEPYTELSFVGENGTAEGYPDELAVGETGHLSVLVTNNRPEPADYTLVTTYRGERTVRNVSVPARGTWRANVSVTPAEPGRQALNATLYEEDGEPYRHVRLWVRGYENRTNR